MSHSEEECVACVSVNAKEAGVASGSVNDSREGVVYVF